MSSPVSLLPLFLLPPSVSPPPLFLHLSSTLHLPRAVIILFHVCPHHPTPLTHTQTHTHASIMLVLLPSFSLCASLSPFLLFSHPVPLTSFSLSMSGSVKISIGLCIFSLLSFSLLYLSFSFFRSHTDKTFSWFTIGKQTVLLLIIAMKYRCKLLSILSISSLLPHHSSSPLQVPGDALKSSFINPSLLTLFLLSFSIPFGFSSKKKRKRNPFFSSISPSPCSSQSPSIGVMSQQGESKNRHILAAKMFLGHLSSIIYFHYFNPPCFPCLSPGVVSLQDNGKTFSVSSTIRIPVERKDDGAALSCEAFHPALNGQKRIRHYRLDVYCKSLLFFCVCVCASKQFLSIFQTN